MLPSVIDSISERENEEGLELQLHSLQVKLKKSEKKNRKLRIKNDRIIQDILLFNHQHNHKLEEENTHLLRGCNEMKELLGCECILEYDEVLSRPDLEKNKIGNGDGTVSVPETEMVHLDVVGSDDHDIEQSDETYLTVKSPTVRDGNIIGQSTRDMEGNDGEKVQELESKVRYLQEKSRLLAAGKLYCLQWAQDKSYLTYCRKICEVIIFT